VDIVADIADLHGTVLENALSPFKAKRGVPV
jgi:hypothetical protein